MKTGDMNISSATEKAGMYAGILRCTMSEQEGEHTVFQNQIGAFTVFSTALRFRVVLTAVSNPWYNPVGETQ